MRWLTLAKAVAVCAWLVVGELWHEHRRARRVRAGLAPVTDPDRARAGQTEPARSAGFPRRPVRP